MNEPSLKDMDAQPFAWVEAVNTWLTHAALWALLLLPMFLRSPAGRLFGDFELMLPGITMWVISPGFLIVFPIMTVLLAIDMLVLLKMYRRPERGVLNIAWNLFMVAVPLGLVTISYLALWFPLLKMHEALSR